RHADATCLQHQTTESLRLQAPTLGARETPAGRSRNDWVTVGHPHPRHVARGRHATILLSNIAYVRIAACHIRRMARRAVVHDDHFIMRMGLRQDALDGFAKKVRLPIAWDDDADG